MYSYSALLYLARKKKKKFNPGREKLRTGWKIHEFLLTINTVLFSLIKSVHVRRKVEF